MYLVTMLNFFLRYISSWRIWCGVNLIPWCQHSSPVTIFPRVVHIPFLWRHCIPTVCVPSEWAWSRPSRRQGRGVKVYRTAWSQPRHSQHLATTHRHRGDQAFALQKMCLCLNLFHFFFVDKNVYFYTIFFFVDKNVYFKSIFLIFRV